MILQAAGAYGLRHKHPLDNRQNGDFMSRIRSTTFCLVLYPDSFDHMIVADQLSSKGYQYSAIIHDKDVSSEDPSKLIKEHMHVVLCFPRQRDLSVVAKELGLEERWIEPARNRVAVERYHCHLDHPDKFQYDPSAIFGPLADQVRAHYESGNSEDFKVLALLHLLDTMPKPCSYRTFIIACCNASLYSTLRRMGSLVRPLLDEHNGYSDGT